MPAGWTVETLKKIHRTKPKNPLIAKLFFMIKHIEQWGTGTDEMIRATVKYGLPEPEFEDAKTDIIVTFRKTKGADATGLNDRQVYIIEYLKKHNHITSNQIQEKYDITKDTVSRDLADLIERRIINKHGAARSTIYRLK